MKLRHAYHNPGGTLECPCCGEFKEIIYLARNRELEWLPSPLACAACWRKIEESRAQAEEKQPEETQAHGAHGSKVIS